MNEREAEVIIWPGKSAKIYGHTAGITGKDDHPEDLRQIGSWEIAGLSISIQDTAVNKNFGESSLWVYKPGDNKGIYRLPITEALLK